MKVTVWHETPSFQHFSGAATIKPFQVGFKILYFETQGCGVRNVESERD